ncbi:hypothetical protein AQUCO_03000128v1 [Aquilegia coerulea]|uniref:Uncharacterized protein n=1 Tax=Aquilegia coerulea TaxID=218851 RepID=A0A2G5D1E4_AQUCA|nr:hypothetical protein AQUCO_03000128v1 [Aquilegia coerulea]
MALQLVSLPFLYSKSFSFTNNVHTSQEIRTIMIKTKPIFCAQPIEQQSVTSDRDKYWDYDYMMSLRSDQDDTYLHKTRVEELKKNVKHLMDNELEGSIAKLELIDAVERLGVSYHFEEDIKKSINNANRFLDVEDLHTVALRFRLLRQHGHDVPQDIFKSFQDEEGKFRSSLCEDVKGMLSLYEASYLGFEDENLMDEAKDFTTDHLKYPKGNISPTLLKKISHSLETPLHWRIPRVEARWYIDIYESEENMIPALLELAKLDYNMVQAAHKKEIGNVSKWWVDLGLKNHLSFLRDRMMTNFIWFTGMIFEPQFGRCREELTKLMILLSVVDDMYDGYGSLEELQLFTEAVERWDVKAMEQLPLYMKILYMALLDTNNNICYEIMKEHDYDIVTHQKKAWVGLCKAFFSEAKWDHQGHNPTSTEGMDDIGAHSIGVVISLIIHCYFFTTKNITKEAIEYLENVPSLIYDTAMILRLADSLVASTVCYVYTSDLFSKDPFS